MSLQRIEELVEKNVAERLLYCVNSDFPRLFRWRDGHVEWRPKWRPWRWRRLV